MIDVTKRLLGLAPIIGHDISRAAIDEIERLRERCRALEHNGCHGLPPTVPLEEFAAGCRAYQRQLYGASDPRLDDLTALLVSQEENIRKARPWETPEYIKALNDEYERLGTLQWAIAERDELKLDNREGANLRERLSSILTRTANALRGEPPPLVSWSWHDLPERVAKLTGLLARLVTHDEAQDFREGVPHCAELEEARDYVNRFAP